MVVAVIALVVALSGTAFAAVNYAQNAGAVDGRSAVGARASLRVAAGKVVATQTGGNGKGRIPARFLDGVMRGGTQTLSKYLRTVDNQAGRPTPLVIVPGIGRLDVQCDDVYPQEGTQTTRTSVVFTASVRQGVNVTRLVGRDIGAGQRARDSSRCEPPVSQQWQRQFHRRDLRIQALLPHRNHGRGRGGSR